MATCTCGHEQDEHGGDIDYPGSSACNLDDCDCDCWEDAELDDEDEDLEEDE